MKINDINNSLCLINIELNDTKTSLNQAISCQTKSIAILLTERNNLFQKLPDFLDFKRFKRAIDTKILFIIPKSDSLAKMAVRSGFPVYLTLEELLAEVHLQTNRKRTTQLGETDFLQQLNPQTIEEIVQSGNLKTIEQAKLVIEDNYQNFTDVQENLKVPIIIDELQEVSIIDESDIQEVPIFDELQEVSIIDASDIQEVPTIDELEAKELLPNFIQSIENEEFYDDQEEQSTSFIDAQEDSKFVPEDSSSYTKYQPINAILKAQPEQQSSLRRTITKLVLLIIIFVTIAGGAGLFLINRSTAIVPENIGDILFLSSQLDNENNDQGINDEIQMTFNGLATPGKALAYYGWLLADKQQGDVTAIPLGKLTVQNGTVNQLFQGTAQHTNLLKTTSRFLITEDNASIPPIAPSPDSSTWKYYGEISQIIPKGSEYSYVDHLRHLLSADPTLDKFGLPGGLNNWFYRNSEKLLEWSNSLRNQTDAGFITRQTTRILTYLDGNTYVSKDLPPNTTILTEERLSQFGLINIVGPSQQTPSFIDHIIKHLNGLLASPGAPKSVKDNAAKILTALANVQYWLSKARVESINLIQSINSHKGSSSGNASNLITDITNAYVGNTNAAVTGSTENGVVYIHSELQQLSFLPIFVFQRSNQIN